MIGIIGAMEPEIKGLNNIMTEKKTVKISSVEFTSGKIHGKDVVTAVCGIGKVFAAICCEAMILNFKPDFVINTGVAGTLTENLSVGDVAVASSLVQHDMDTSAIGDERGLISGINIINIPVDKKLCSMAEKCVGETGAKHLTGVIASGDCFIADDTKKTDIKSVFNAIACEMEGASIAQVCYVNNVKFCVIRAISDSADNSSNISYSQFLPLAAKNSQRVCEELIKLC